jgi:hypothetical protein
MTCPLPDPGVVTVSLSGWSQMAGILVTALVVALIAII